MRRAVILRQTSGMLFRMKNIIQICNIMWLASVFCISAQAESLPTSKATTVVEAATSAKTTNASADDVHSISVSKTIESSSGIYAKKLVWNPNNILNNNHNISADAPHVVSESNKPWVQLKNLEQEKNWSACVSTSEANTKKISINGELGGWAALIWAKCLSNLDLEKKNVVNAQTFFKWFDKNSATIKSTSGPWKESLLQEVLKLRLNFAEVNKVKRTDLALKQVELALDSDLNLDKELSAKAYGILADIMSAQGHTSQAQYYYEQSLAQKESKFIREKLRNAQKILNTSNGKKDEAVRLDWVPEAEKEYEDKFKNLLKNQDHLGLVKEALLYLEKYPGGKKSKWAQDKILEIYTMAVDAATEKGGLDKLPNLDKTEKSAKANEDLLEAKKEFLSKVRQAMLKADTMRLVEWSRLFHRRNDFMGSLVMAEKVLSDNPVGSAVGILYYIAGRSAQFTGDYQKSLKYFNLYIEKFSNGDDLNEVLFRSALVNIRLQEYSTSVAFLEKLLIQKNMDRHELSARYWLVRSLQLQMQKQGNNNFQSRIDDETKNIITKFPISYYALKLKAEKDSGELKWPLPDKIESTLAGEIYLLPGQMAQMNRIKKLIQCGWILEAQDEITNFAMPADLKLKFLLSQEWLSAKAYPMIIKIFNEVVDAVPEVRSLEAMQMVYPQEYQKEIFEQAQKQKLNPLLVKSLIRQESAFGQKAVSTSNAYGLMQMIGPTAQEVAEELKINGLEIPNDLFQPAINIRMGTYYIAKVIRQLGGHVPLGLAAYNAGPHKVISFLRMRPELLTLPRSVSGDFKDEIWFDELPWSETSFYVKAILRNVLVYKMLEKSNGGVSSSIKLDQVLWSDLVLPM